MTMKKVVFSLAMWALIVFVPAHVSFAYTYPQYPYNQYQLYWCSGYYSYSPCPQQYYYYPSYSYPQYIYPQYYPSYSYNNNQNYNYNNNLNYNYNGGYYDGYWW